ncbi:putative transposable element [Trichonephila clavipes]|nr:putative transposable element [Trichonephila clavipes]
MRCIGQGLESLKTFCAVMSLPNPVEQKSHDVINNKLSPVMKEVANESMKMAAVEEYSSSPDNLLTEMATQKTFNALSENKPYGDDHLIQKIECVGHVQKRMGTRPRKLKLVYSKKKLSDGKTIGGKGRLTDSLIDKLAHYYGNAIRCNSTSVKEMRKAVWGHSCSTDDEPMHWFCPTNPNTWFNGDRYRAMITNFFFPELNNYDVQELWFQQDGATCHTARATIDLLKDKFGDHLILRFGPVNWPPRSCDLTPLDYFLWGYVKSLVYADKPQMLDHLEGNILRVIADIRPQMLEKVIENWTSKFDYIRTSRSHMPEIMFKV